MSILDSEADASLYKARWEKCCRELVLTGNLGNLFLGEWRGEVLPSGRGKEQVPPQKSLSVLKTFIKL